jgi:DNA glycosylase AlkZ-like
MASPADVVASLGAMQAQDYHAALWALGLRTPGATEASIETALREGDVIRTHVMRATWQYLARDDVPWILALIGPRVIATLRPRFRRLELDDRRLGRCGDLFSKALADGGHLTRREMQQTLERARVSATGVRLAHILAWAELSGIICSGGRRGRQQTFALLDDRVPASSPLARDEALATLALRYFTSRAPATERDFTWWSGLTLGTVREAIDLAGSELETIHIDGVTYHAPSGSIKRTRSRSPDVHLLPAFDEYLIGYRDRSALVEPAHAQNVNGGGGLLRPIIVIDGIVSGTWKRTLAKDGVDIVAHPFRPLNDEEYETVHAASGRYGDFLGLRARVPAG